MYNFFFLFLRTSGGNTIVNDVKHHCYMNPWQKLTMGSKYMFHIVFWPKFNIPCGILTLESKFFWKRTVDCYWKSLERWIGATNLGFCCSFNVLLFFLNLPKGHFACMKSATLQTMHTLWSMVQIITRNNCPHWEGILGRIKYQIYYY
jgi:hypothetical protein